VSVPVCILRADPAVEVARPGYRFKVVFNARGIIFGPMSLQHTELRAPNIAFQGDEAGNAAAAVIFAGRIEVRAHPAVSADAARGALERLFAQLPALAPLKGFEIVYAARKLGRLGGPG
jgi:hypothetical protein